VVWAPKIRWLRQKSTKGALMRSRQINQLCVDWLTKNYGEEFALEYQGYSLVIPAVDSYELNEGLDTLGQVLCIAFGPGESSGTTDYHDARKKLGLPEDQIRVPDVFVRPLSEARSGGEKPMYKLQDYRACFPAAAVQSKSDRGARTPW
jgi:hypothetical protein